jgi:hypothetical protein
MMTKEQQFAWVVGILEGEGCFKIHPSRKTNSKEYFYPQVEVNMADEDTIRRIHEFSGIGNVQGPYVDKRNPTYSPMWRWSVQKHQDALKLMKEVLPFMSARRSTKIKEILSIYTSEYHNLV